MGKSKDFNLLDDMRRTTWNEIGLAIVGTAIGIAIGYPLLMCAIAWGLPTP